MKVYSVLFGIILCILIESCVSFDCTLTPKSNEGRLRQSLFCNYQNTVRPTAEFNNATYVWVTMFIKSFTYDDNVHTLMISSRTFLTWIDHRLKWNKTDYDNLASIAVSGETLWTPDFTIYNSKLTQFGQACQIGNCRVGNGGWVLCTPQCLFEGDCKPDYTQWPFDSQNCTMQFGAWIDYGEEVNFRPQYNSVKDSYSHQKEWKLVSLTTKRLPGNLTCCSNETLPSLHYSFIIQRHSASERAFVFAPAIIFASINVMTLLLDPGCLERILLSVLSIFAHLMFIQQLSWLIPKNGDTVPTFLLYARDSFIISTILLLYTIFTRSLMTCQLVSPSWLRSLILKIKNHKIGRYILNHNYLLHKSTFRASKEDVESLMQNEYNDVQPVKEENTPWTMAAKILDRLTFALLLLIYITMMLAWVPASYEKHKGYAKVKTIRES